MSTFTEQLKKYPAYWVPRLTYNAVRQRVKMSLIADPEKEEVVAKLTFHRVTEARSSCAHAETTALNDSMHLPALLSVRDEPEGEAVRYTLTTDTTELTFVTNQTPVIQWIDGRQMYREWEEEQLKKDWD